MSVEKNCLKCGAPLATNAHDGVCPACLLEHALQSSAAASSERAFATTVDRGLPAGHAAAAPHNLPPVKPGDTLGGYRIIAPLGHGGMGAVYEAEHLESGRRLALKLLSHSLDSPDARKRFFREGRLAASVNHPHSVYVYGTEEINGTPAISMELVPGGTLQQLVKERGPLPMAEAVDIILQVIAGLEAAQSLGVLHRDVKPANCFVSSDGTVKVGDFGLSISTQARGESHLTNSGAFLGTPAFSSPEQLKGDELDVRSDIYAVGVTLYYLLTGRTPFVADNLVKLLATVFEQAPPSPAKWRAEIPADLAQAVLTCLEKQPAQRYKNYAELRAALQPFSSSVPVPATLPVRFLAGSIDQLMLLGISLAEAAVLALLGIYTIAEGGTRAEGYPWLFGVGLILEAAYFAVPEALWGASLGKWLCGLRVVNAQRSAPGLPRALARALIYIVLPVLPTWILLGGDPNQLFGRGHSVLWSWLILMSYYPLLALLFSTARRRNGYAAWHDLASRTQVVVKQRFEERPKLVAAAEGQAATVGTSQLGPYSILGTLGAAAGSEWLLGYDTRLLRKVWIRRLPLGSPPAETRVRNVARIGRLRWLGGRRSPEECWDVYEAASGVPLLHLVHEPQPWSCVRYWLYDLAQELAAGLKDDSLPATLGLNRLWITADGRLKLLDFPAPSLPATISETEFATVPGEVGPTRLLLQQLATATLTGQPLAAEAAPRHQSFGPLPLHATHILHGLAHAQRPEVVAAQLQPVLHKRVAVSRENRWGLWLGCLLFPAVCAISTVAFIEFGRVQEKKFPTVQSLHQYLELHSPIVLAGTSPTLAESDRQALEVYIVGHYSDTINDPEIWQSVYCKMAIPNWERETAERLVAEHSRPSAAELAQANAKVEKLLAGRITFNPFDSLSLFFIGFLVFASSLFSYVALPSLLAALLCRGGLILAMFGLVGVTRTGQRASRLRMFGRALLIWSPLLAAPILLALLMPLAGVEASLAILGAGYLALVAWSAMLPTRGLADRLAGTFLVPR